MTPTNHYVETVLAEYSRLPGTLGRILRDDHQTARLMCLRGVSLDVVRQAFLLAVARRTFGPPQSSPIRCLRYFLPVITEIQTGTLDPAYLAYLQNRLATDRAATP